MSRVICDWTTYKGSHCKKIIACDDDKTLLRFCDMHKDLILEYTKIKDQDEELCETFKEIKVIPRSYKHIKTIMSGLNYEEDKVQVYLAGGCIEDANISNRDCIVLDSDNSQFYYRPIRGQNKAKDLKVILREYCKNNCIVEYAERKYCEECYKNKVKDAPRISCLI